MHRPLSGRPIMSAIQHRHASEAGHALAERAARWLSGPPVSCFQRTLILPGGDSPRHFLPLLFAHPLAWDEWTLLPGDERRVAGGQAERNDAMIAHWRQGTPAAAARLLRLLPDDPQQTPSPEVGAHLPATLAILGMGADGHIASLFAESDLEAGKLLAWVDTTRPADGAQRVSLTIDALCASRNLLLFTGGPAKAAALARATTGDGTPLAALLAARPDCEIHLYNE